MLGILSLIVVSQLYVFLKTLNNHSLQMMKLTVCELDFKNSDESTHRHRTHTHLEVTTRTVRQGGDQIRRHPLLSRYHIRGL